jgi:hypothetical protein
MMTNDERLKQKAKSTRPRAKSNKATKKVVNKVRDAVKED